VRGILGYLALWYSAKEHRVACEYCEEVQAEVIRWLYYTCKQED